AGPLGRQRRERRLPDEAARAAGEHGDDVGAAVDEPATDLDGLVRRDPAGDAEDDAASLEQDLPSRTYSSPGSAPAPSPGSEPSPGRTITILSLAISSNAIDSALPATEVASGGTMEPSPSPSWFKYPLIS